MFGSDRKVEMVTADSALPGRDQAIPVPERHFVLDSPEQSVVGVPQVVYTSETDTLADLARTYGLGYDELLAVFWKNIDPTDSGGQFCDRGTQYRSAIFTVDEEQARIAREVLAAEEAGDRWKLPVVTEIVEATPFYPAEGYHQDYLQKHPHGYTCHYLRD